MSTDLVIYQGDDTRWGSDPYSAMISAAKARKLRMAEISRAASEQIAKRDAEERKRQEICRLIMQAERSVRLAREGKFKAKMVVPELPVPRPPSTRRERYSKSYKIAKVVARMRGVACQDIFTPIRIMKIAHARQIAIYFVKQITGWPLPQIGRAFGRDHTTVLYAIRKIADYSAADETFRAELATIGAAIAEEMAAAAGT
jgi:hypothetical protein